MRTNHPHTPDSARILKTRSRHLRRGWAWALLGALIGVWVLLRFGLTFGISLPNALDPKNREEIDPKSILRIEAQGVGSHLTEVQLKEDGGLIASLPTANARFEIRDRLDYDKTYELSVRAERGWLQQSERLDLRFHTVRVPKITSALRQALSADGAVTLGFDGPIGSLKATGDLPLEVTLDAAKKTATLKALPGQYRQGQVYPLSVAWQSPRGVALPPFTMEISTAPALTATIPINGMHNLGLAMPVDIEFSEALADRTRVTPYIRIKDQSGQTLPGKWVWYGKERVQFRPEPYWPAHSQIEVTVDPKSARSIRGGFIAEPLHAHFGTGSDRRVDVFLDRQRVEVHENGELIRTMRASTGKSKTPTVTGSFYIYARFPKKTMKSTGLKPGQKGYYEVKDVPYAQYFHEGYAFHGAFWHNAFGQPASHGCINLATQKQNSRKGINEDAGWLYEWASLGVPVTIHGSSKSDTVASGAAQPNP